MASQYTARLGVVLGIDTAKWEADINEVINAQKKLKREISAQTKAAEKELLSLGYAVKDYGKELTKVEQIQREFLAGGRFANAAQNVKDRLLQEAAAYDKIREAAKKANQEKFVGMLGGMQGGQLNQRQLAALGYQTTDILTGLASGQNPMMVLIQQGGQLRDQFGGFIPLFKAIGSVLTATRLIVGGLAGAIGALTFAAYQGKEEFKELRNGLLLTNNIAGLTFGEVNRLRDALANRLNVSLADSRAIFLELVKSGRFSADTMDSVAKVIANVAKFSGESADIVSKDLIPAFNGTAASAKALNDRFNFLTLAQYKQIEALDLAGEKQRAAKMTADLLNASIEKQKDTLQITEGWWSKLTRSISDFWEKFKQIGAPETDEEKLMRLGKTIENLANRANAGTLFDPTVQAKLMAKAVQDYLNQYESMVKKRQEIEANAAKQQQENKRIEDDIFAGGEKKRLDILADIRKLQADREFQDRVFGLNELQRVEAEAVKKNQEALNDMIKANIDERYVFAALREQEYQEKVLRNELEKQQKIAEISRKAAEEVRKEQQGRLDALMTEKEKLEIYERNLFISDKDYKIALNRLKAEQEIAKIRANPQMTEGDKQTAIERERAIQQRADEIAGLEERLKHLRDVSASVWSNMETALTNFVRTGKFQFKDFARSVIQDILTIYMRAQMLQMFNMGKSFLGSFMGGSMYTDASGMFQVGMALADGGEPPVGKVSLVGERGPELFVPKTAGTIIPNHELGNLGGPQIVYNGPYIASMSAIDTQSAVQFLAQNKQAVYAANLSATRSLPASR